VHGKLSFAGDRHLFAANEALGWHYGGVTATAEATGLARSTINRGIGLKVTEREMQAVNIARHNFHGDWNYTISPNHQPP